MSDSVTALENEAASPTLMSAKVNSITAPSSLHRDRFSAQEASGDNHPLHFGRALIELRNLGIAISPLDRVTFRVSISTVDLDCPVSNARRRKHSVGVLSGTCWWHGVMTDRADARRCWWRAGFGQAGAAWSGGIQGSPVIA